MSRAFVLARQQLALRFQVAPVEYAHQSWWSTLFVDAFGAAVQTSEQANGHLSAWMLSEYDLADRIDLEFDPAAKRFWLLPAELIRRTAVELGLALHRNVVRCCVMRSSWQLLRSRFECAAIDYALSDAAAELVPPARSAAVPELVPDVADCADAGASALLREVDPDDGPLAKRARLIFPRPWRINRATGGKNENGAAVMTVAVARALQSQPSWRWLFS